MPMPFEAHSLAERRRAEGMTAGGHGVFIRLQSSATLASHAGPVVVEGWSGGGGDDGLQVVDQLLVETEGWTLNRIERLKIKGPDP